MKRLLGVVSLGACGAILIGACGGKVVFETGNGGAGGSGSTTSAKGPAQGNTTHANGTTTGQVSTTFASTTGFASTGDFGTTAVSVGPSVTVGQTTGVSVGSGQQCQATCAMQHQMGFVVLGEAIVQTCGCAPSGACEMECAGTPVCNFPPGPPNGPCGQCLQSQFALGPGSACVLSAATGALCQSNMDCSALITCILSC